MLVSNRLFSIMLFWVYLQNLWEHSIIKMRMKIWHAFLQSPETFRGYFGCHNFLSILNMKTFSRHEISQQISPFVSWNHSKRTAFWNKQITVLEIAFRAQKVFGTFEKWAPELWRCWDIGRVKFHQKIKVSVVYWVFNISLSYSQFQLQHCKGLLDRVKAVAFTDSVHSLPHQAGDNKKIIKWMRKVHDLCTCKDKHMQPVPGTVANDKKLIRNFLFVVHQHGEGELITHMDSIHTLQYQQSNKLRTFHVARSCSWPLAWIYPATTV